MNYIRCQRVCSRPTSSAISSSADRAKPFSAFAISYSSRNVLRSVVTCQLPVLPDVVFMPWLFRCSDIDFSELDINSTIPCCSGNSSLQRYSALHSQKSWQYTRIISRFLSSRLACFSCRAAIVASRVDRLFFTLSLHICWSLRIFTPPL